MQEDYSTHVVFEHPACSFEDANNHHRVIASRDIKENTILLIENVVTDEGSHGEIVRLVQLVRCNSALYNSLYPRTDKWTDKEMGDNYNKTIINEKVTKNMFKGKDGYYLGKRVSWLNHSLTPNCTTYYNTFDMQGEIKPTFMSIITIRAISAGEEINICYNPSIGIVDGDVKQLPVPADVNLPEVTPETKNKIIFFIKRYMNSDIARMVIINHLSIYYGLYHTPDIMNCTDRFLTFVKKKFGKSYKGRDAVLKWYTWLDENISREGL